MYRAVLMGSWKIYSSTYPGWKTINQDSILQDQRQGRVYELSRSKCYVLFNESALLPCSYSSASSRSSLAKGVTRYLKQRANQQGVVYLGTEWASNPVVRSDIVVSHFLDSVGGYRHKARRDKLLALLDVDLDWYVNPRSFTSSSSYCP